MKKLVIMLAASAFGTTSAFANCGCTGDSIPAVAFGQKAVIVDLGPSKPVKTPAVRQAPAQAKQVPAARYVPAPVKPASTTGSAVTKGSATGAQVSCLTSSTSNAYTVKWVRGGDGECPGKVAQGDLADLAKLADSGKTVFRVAFYIPAKCDSGWAKMPAKVNGKTISLEPWNKTCVGGHFKAQVLK